jgi:hypothetical protein
MPRDPLCFNVAICTNSPLLSLTIGRFSIEHVNVWEEPRKIQNDFKIAHEQVYTVCEQIICLQGNVESIGPFLVGLF